MLAAACGDRRAVPAGTAPATSGSGGAAGSGLGPAGPSPVEAAWTWGPEVKPEYGPRAVDPNEPRPTGPAAIAAGKGRVVVGTQDGCVELLDAATGKDVVPRRCEKDTYTLGLAVVGDVAVVARQRDLIGVSLTDLKEVWRRSPGFVQLNQPVGRPSLVDDRMCMAVTTGKGQVIECLDVATGTPVGSWSIPSASRVAFGEHRIGVIPFDGKTKTPAPDPGLELAVQFFDVTSTLVHESKLAAPYGPTFEQARPMFVVRGGGNQSMWVHRFVDADGAEILTTTNKMMLRGAAVIAPGTVVTTGFGVAGSKDRVMALAAPAGSVAWSADLDGSGPWDPWHAQVGGFTYVAHFATVYAIDKAGAIVDRLPIASSTRRVWRDRLLFLVEAHETRSDSDFGDAGVYAIDAATHKVVFADAIGRDIAGGQRASEPVFDGNMVFAIAGGKLHAYRVR